MTVSQHQQLQQEAYNRGLQTGKECLHTSIALNGVWSGTTPDGYIQSYEKIGYHARSLDFIRGVIASNCPVYRFCKSTDGKIVSKRIWSVEELEDLVTPEYHKWANFKRMPGTEQRDEEIRQNWSDLEERERSNISK